MSFIPRDTSLLTQHQSLMHQHAYGGIGSLKMSWREGEAAQSGDMVLLKWVTVRRPQNMLPWLWCLLLHNSSVHSVIYTPQVTSRVISCSFSEQTKQTENC